MEERSLFQKILLVILAAMILLFGVLTGIVRGRTGVLFHDALLEVRGTPENGSYSGESHGETVSIVVSRSSQTETSMGLAIGNLIDESWLVEYPLEPIRTEHGDTKPGLRVYKEDQLVFEGAYDPADYSDVLGHILYDKNGEWTIEHSFGFHAATESSYWVQYETGVNTVLEFVNGPELTARGSWQMYAMATLVAIMAMVLTAFPLELFEMNHHWYVKDPEPTELYFVMNRVSSCFLALVALIVYIMGVRQLP